MNILLVTSSFSPTSYSTALALHAGSAIKQRHPEAQVEHLDLASNPAPLYDGVLAGAVFAGHTTPEALTALQRSNDYIAQLRRADLLVVAVPMHNFGVPATLKSWMDQVARAGVTFEYTSEGPRGLVNIPALVVSASGGVYTAMPWAGNNHASTHAETFFAFLGMDVQHVALEGTASKSPQEFQASVMAAQNDIDQRLRGWNVA